MFKLIKLLLGLTVLLVVMVTIALVGVVVFFDPNEHKDFIISKVKDQTGRTFAITGDIELTYYPWLGLEADGVSLGNAQGFGDESFLRVESVAMRIKTLPLLKQQYELDTLKLKGLQVNLAKNKEGKTNWGDLVARPAETKDEKVQEPLQLAAVILGGVDIQDTSITWSDQGTGQEINVTNLDIATGELTYGAPIELTLAMKVAVNQPAISSDINLNGTLSYDLETEQYSFKPIDLIAKLAGENIPGGSTEMKLKAGALVNLADDTATVSDISLEGLGTIIKGNLVANNIQSGTPAMTGSLDVKGKDLALLFKVADIEPLAGELSKLKTRAFDFSTSVDADMAQGKLHISDLKANLIGASIDGQIDAKNIKSRTPAVKGKLQATGPDLPTLLQVAGQFEGGTDPKLKTYGAKLARVPDKGFDVATEFDADLKTGNINVPTLSAKALGIVVNGQLLARDINTDKGNIDGKLSIQGGQLAEVLAAFDQAALGQVLTSINVAAGVKGNRSDINLTPLEAKATFAGKQIPNSPVDMTLSANTKANLDKQTLDITRLMLTGLGLKVAGDINAKKILSDKPAVKGKLDIKGEDLALLIKIAGIEPLASQLGQLKNRSFDLVTAFDADLDSGNIKVPTLAANTLGITTDGQLTVRDINSSKGNIDGKLSIRGKELAGIMTALGYREIGKVLHAINLDAGVKGSRSDISLSPLDIKATFAGKQIPDSPVTATFNADSKINLDKQTLSISNLALNGMGLKIGANINASKIMEQPDFSGNIKVAEFNLRKLAKQLNQALPETADNNVLSKVSLKTGFSGNTDNLSLKDLLVNLDETQLKGDLAVAHFTQPAIKFGIGIDKINVDRYLPPPANDKQKKKTAPKTPETAAAGAATELPIETLRTLNVSGDLLIGNLVISNARLSNVRLSVRAKEGDIKLDPIAANLYQGEYQGAVTLDAKGKVPRLAMNTSLQDVQIEPLLKDYTQQPESQLLGVASVTTEKLTAAGNSVEQLKHSLTGNARFQVKDGVLRGVDVRKTIEQAEVMLENKQFGGQVKQGGETAFEKLKGTLDIKNGVVRNEDLVMTSPGFRVSGKGTLANLHDNTIKYDLKVAVDETSATRGEQRYNIGGYKIPIRCNGKLDHLESACQPDLAGIAKVAVEKGVKDKIKESIDENLGEKLKDLIKF